MRLLILACLALFCYGKGKRMYKEQRNYENVQRMYFERIGEYEVAQIEPTQFDNAEFIEFNYARSAKEADTKAVHFFLDDYQFIRVWSDPDRYVMIKTKWCLLLITTMKISVESKLI